MGSTLEPPVLRRSLRILAKQKLKEEKQAKLLTDKPGNKSDSTLAESETVEVKGDTVAEENRGAKYKRPPVKPAKSTRGSTSEKGSDSSRKRKRTSSPLSLSSPPKKQVKKSPVSNRKGRRSTGETRNSVACSSSLSAASSEGQTVERLSEKRHSKRKQSKEQVVCTKGNTSNRDRETVIVDAASARKRSRKSSSSTGHAKPEQSTKAAVETTSSEPGLRKKARRSKATDKSRSEGERISIPKGKGRTSFSTANYSLPSLVDFARLNMASPG